MTKQFQSVIICTIAIGLAVPPIAAAQQYTTIDFPGAIVSFLSGGPNPQGTSVGVYTDTSNVTHGFVLTKKGVFTSFDVPGSTFTGPNFISPQGDIVGSYNDASSVSHGFILSGGHFTTVNFPGAPGTILTGVTPSGEMSGATCSDPACGVFGAINATHGFLVSKKGVFSPTFDPPGAVSSVATIVIPSGAVFGQYDKVVEGTCFTQCQGYMLFHGAFATINFPGSSFTGIGGANAEGNAVGFYLDASGVGHGLLFNGVYTSFDYPGAIFTQATGINPRGVIVGLYVDSAFVIHGFIRTP